MDRREFVVGLGALTAVLWVTGCTGLLPKDCDTASCTPALNTQLTDLVDPRFLEYAKSRSVQALYTEMVRKGVISANYEVNVEKLKVLARDEPIVVYQGFYYTQTELDLYALAWLNSNT